MITSSYAALLGLIYVFLSFRIIGLRRNFKVALGDGGHPSLLRAIRVHANFAEYAPFALLLIFFVESRLAPVGFIHFLGLLLLIARLMHAWGVGQDNEVMYRRQIGMVGTFCVLILASSYLIYHQIFY